MKDKRSKGTSGGNSGDGPNGGSENNESKNNESKVIKKNSSKFSKKDNPKGGLSDGKSDGCAKGGACGLKPASGSGASCSCQDKVFDEFLNDVENDMKMEHYQQLWKKYGKLISAGMTLVVGGTVMFAFWQKYDNERREEVAASFVNAQQLIEQGKTEDAVGLLVHIGSTYRGAYKALAKLSHAATLMAADFAKNAEEIQGIYLSVLEQSIPAYMKELVSVLFVNAKLQQTADIDEAQGRELLTLLRKYRCSDNGFALLSKELEGVVAFKLGDFVTARQAFDEISKNEDTPAGMQSRISIMIQAIQDKGTEGDAPKGAVAAGGSSVDEVASGDDGTGSTVDESASSADGAATSADGAANSVDADGDSEVPDAGAVEPNGQTGAVDEVSLNAGAFEANGTGAIEADAGAFEATDAGAFEATDAGAFEAKEQVNAFEATDAGAFEANGQVSEFEANGQADAFDEVNSNANNVVEADDQASNAAFGEVTAPDDVSDQGAFEYAPNS
ncbi:MAG: tetratricopeptide repeat protein [Holosporales bacterium]|jgi:hypothetical protein|nr:tetratricopeptide repeat protein [Holosporales bacterium]